MDFQTPDQLIAYKNKGSIEKIRKEIGADELIYLSLDGLHKVVRDTYGCGICDGCFSGNYPMRPKELTDKFC
jgi:amidophosphoribosyltransferase